MIHDSSMQHLTSAFCPLALKVRCFFFVVVVFVEKIKVEEYYFALHLCYPSEYYVLIRHHHRLEAKPCHVARVES